MTPVSPPGIVPVQHLRWLLEVCVHLATTAQLDLENQFPVLEEVIAKNQAFHHLLVSVIHSIIVVQLLIDTCKQWCILTDMIVLKVT